MPYKAEDYFNLVYKKGNGPEEIKEVLLDAFKLGFECGKADKGILDSSLEIYLGIKQENDK